MVIFMRKFGVQQTPASSLAFRSWLVLIVQQSHLDSFKIVFKFLMILMVLVAT